MHKLMRKYAASKKPRPSRPEPHGSDDLKRLGKKLAAGRHRAGLSQSELATEAGLSTEYISLLERGGRNPLYTTLLLVARALKTTVGRLVPE